LRQGRDDRDRSSLPRRIRTVHEETPSGHLPPAAQPPYPAQPAPHPQRDEALAHLPTPTVAPAGPAIGALGVTLIGGAVAAAVGLLVALPLLRRAPEPKKAAAKRRGRPRKPSAD
jgi:hypothetical protein